MSVKLIVADVDGCLSPEESVPWELEPFMKLAHLARDAAEGRNALAPITLCTGRPQPYTEVLAKLLDIRQPIICENGAAFYTLHNNHAWYGPGVTEEKVLGLRDVRGFIETAILPEFPGVVIQYGKEAQLSVFSENPEIFASIQPLIEGFVADRGGPDLLITASHFYLNISLTGVDKGNALRALFEMLGCSGAEAAGIGDTEGDLPLREAVGFFACPSNARDSIKAVADYVSPYPMIHGVLDILERPEFRREA